MTFIPRGCEEPHKVEVRDTNDRCSCSFRNTTTSAGRGVAIYPPSFAHELQSLTRTSKFEYNCRGARGPSGRGTSCYMFLVVELPSLSTIKFPFVSGAEAFRTMCEDSSQ